VDDPPAGYDIPTIMTRMTPWNFSRAMVELQLTFRRIGLCLSHDSTRAQAEAYLSTFTTSFLEHALDPEETDLVADVLRGLSGFVADQVSLDFCDSF
jgi:mediator of RNA polymerase II transcription subunit 12, fungi type